MHRAWVIVPWSSVFYVCQTDKTVIKHVFSAECITPHFLLDKIISHWFIMYKSLTNVKKQNT